MTKQVLAAALISISLAGCANFNSVYRDLKTGEGTGALIDIKQRAIIASKTGEGTNQKIIVCAEPSPDALSAYAAELAGKADLPSGTSAQLSSAFQESASFTGLRTQSIQLLRDSMYRMCEAHMNGAITAGQYDILARRYQKHTVALLAIEQLTGAIKAPAVTINTSGSAEAARSISEMRVESSALDKKITDLETKKAASGASDADKKNLDEQIKQLKSDKEAIAKGIENAKGTLVSGNATANVSNLGVLTQRNDEHIQAIAGTVEKIVTSIINTDDRGQLCFLQLSNDTQTTSEGHKKIQDYCLQTLAFEQTASKIQIDALQESLKNLLASNATPAIKAAESQKIAEQAEKLANKFRLLSAPFKPKSE
ncbi:hypothetical protein [Undibacterium flavidum]|uniref:Uncharacterized protein n=1 Tax=Undibacterium flavidum TaxID=2762297 RepID=A0ABR6Y9K1_9BURK|nr:hypothetical protein [Undibacterium flavidum]MBC3873304.1 hypothetical protein [Undibacterium flavidum]